MTASPVPARGALLLVEDDAIFAGVMARALTARGFEVSVAHDAASALQQVKAPALRFAVVDLKLGADSGLTLIPALLHAAPALRILLLTGYASIATAVEAIKRGAHDYLAKPVDADTVMRALLDDYTGDGEETLPKVPLPLRRVEWEHIQRTLHECHDNISEAARRLGMHRRTLQRKLAKHPAREHSA
ncbi:MAG TPA: response regulator transcription factor [Rhodanobacteraceae bacterium]